jgi:hypothetical protein
VPPSGGLFFEFIPDGDIGCCYCSAEVQIQGAQPNRSFLAELFVWDGPGHPQPGQPIETQETTTDQNGDAVVLFNTDINNDDNSSSAQWARVVVNGVSGGDFQQASCFNPATSTPTITPSPTNTPTATSTPTATPTSTPPSTLAVELGLQIFGSLTTCQALVLITGAQPSTSYPASLFVQDQQGPITGQPIETIDIFTFGDGTGRSAFRSLVANNTGQYAQVMVLGVGSGWTAVDASTCEPS